ncbi:hypothetical protein [Facklamia sp. 7083-14-GEN3]|uniref:YkvI family membrane protein n=1 Tax=Facklamia sp. 7083-14-GEN3 TaxID=2973478 RepID=UPI00215CCB21|nr:hypothetical protein [Facklamia sp. 7083-14-GEN3]MCR8969680.1 hypothetical protein [Facklamia sp. 7083-14-GEN3]
MNRKTLTIAFAYVGVVTGAGLASGQELLQYFISFGSIGLFGIFLVGLMHALMGAIVMQLGSYFQSDHHSIVLSEITSPWIEKVLDWALIFTCFVIGFVMIAGAGASLQQQFNLNSIWGSALCVLLVLIIGSFNFKKIQQIIGFFTPVLISFIILAFFYTLFNYQYDFEKIEVVSQELNRLFPSIILSSLNYFSMCFITGFSMAVVISGDALRPRFAGLGGLIGGILVGLMGIAITIILFMRIEVVKDAEIPMQIILNEIHPVLGLLMSLIIYGMILNTALSLFFACARRLSSKHLDKFYTYYVVVTLVGFALSFLGFKELVAIMYPILGFIGMGLIAIIITGWLRHRPSIIKEHQRRKKILKLTHKKYNPSKLFKQKDENKLEDLVDASNLVNEDLKQSLKERMDDQYD